MPFLLLIALLAGQYASGSRPRAYEIAFGVAAALVAILPLRTVLVPNTLPGLTRLDIFLGIGAAVLVALSILLAILWAPADKQQPERCLWRPDQPGTFCGHEVPAVPVPGPGESPKPTENGGAAT